MATKTAEGRILLTKEEVLQILDWVNDSAHTFIQNHHVFVGAEWPKDSIEKEIDEAVSVEISGAASRSMRHGVAMIRQDKPSPVFLATDEDKIRALEVSIGERKAD